MMKRNFGFLFAFFAIVLIAAIFGVFRITEERVGFKSLIGESYRNLSTAMRLAQSGDSIAANDSIILSSDNIGRLDGNLFSKLISFFWEDADFMAVLEDLGVTAMAATKSKDDFTTKLPVVIFTDGEKAREIVGSLYDSVNKITALSSSFRNQASAINAFSGSDYLAIQSDLEEAKKALTEGVRFLSEDGEIIFILIDERQATPFGGRPISGAVAPFRGGRIIAREAVAIPKNIFEAGEMTDAFNFDMVANRIASDFKSEKKPKAVIAVNFTALKKILSLTGPAELPEEKAVLDAYNVREVIMKDKDGDVFAAALVKLASGISYLPKSGAEIFSEEMRIILERRDMQIHFSDYKIPVFESEDNFSIGDDYLAIFGSFTKTESASLRAKVEVDVDLYSDGSSYGKVVATRVAPATVKGDIFWRLLLPKGSSIENISGGETRREVTGSAPSELSVFEYRAGSGIFGVEYKRVTARAGKYRLIYERQPGADVSLSIKVAAPAEYVFAETGRGEYLYESDDPPGRLIINLSTVKLR